MKRFRFISVFLVVCLLASLLSACKNGKNEVYTEIDENTYEYRLNFLPGVDGESQPYVGDVMPYYEDGVFYLYYLKDGGDSFNHSVYLATTTDFVSYKEIDKPVLEASEGNKQDLWIGTGSIVKLDNRYCFFYTGHTDDASHEYAEKIMLAVSDNPYKFDKVEGWEITPPEELGQKRDFRDPQVYYDANTNKLYMTVTAAKDGVASILKYTMNTELTDIKYEGVLLTDPTGEFWNLECSDCFKIGSKWYITYSAQDDTLWYAVADSRFGEYSTPVRMDGKLFYAAKHISDGTNNYMVGWTRRSEAPATVQELTAWAGNMSVHRLFQNADGTLCLAPVENIENAFDKQKALLVGSDEISIRSFIKSEHKKVFNSCERFMLKGKFSFKGTGSFGLEFCCGVNAKDNRLISINPSGETVTLAFNNGKKVMAQTTVKLEKNTEYSFTYIQEGSAGAFYIDDLCALTVRIYGTGDNPISLFSKGNNVAFSDLKEFTSSTVS